jgi:hypothetical protein
MQNGGMFWDVISAAVKQHGEKKYLKGFSQDSNFLNEDIKAFLESRSWEKGRSGGSVAPTPKIENDDVPF